MLTSLAFFRAKSGQTKSLGKALTDLVDPTRQEAGCISYDVHQSLQDSDSWFVYENWRSSSDPDAPCRRRIDRSRHLRLFSQNSDAGAGV